MAVYYADLNGNVTTKRNKKKKTTADQYEYKNGKLVAVKNETEEVKGGNKDSYFKAGGFSDGVDGVGDFFVDLGQTTLGTIGDIGVGLGKGVTRTGEGLTDLVGYGVAGVADFLGADKFARKVKKGAQSNTTDKMWKGAADYVDQYSVLGNKSDGITEGIGQVATTILTAGAGGAAGLGAKGVTALTSGMVGTSAMGSGMSEAYEGGATDEEAFKYGLISGAAEVGTELFFGGLGKATGAVGISKGILPWDDALAKKVSSKFNNQIVKNLAEYGIKAGAEGTEEVLSGMVQAWGKSKTYMSEKDFEEILKDERLLDQFIAGAVTSGIAQSGYVPGMRQGSVREANATGRDFITGNTKNEQVVIDKVVEDRIKEMEDAGEKVTAKKRTAIEEQVQKAMEEGDIDIDKIESILGGDDYKSYTELVKEMDEFNTLNRMKKMELSGEQEDRLAELKAKNNVTSYESEKTRLKGLLAQNVQDMVKNDRLVESYNEKTRRGQAYEADLSQYDEAQRVVIQNAANSGILNNTNKTHKFVDWIARVCAEKGVTFDFTNNQKLKESSLALNGRVINGYVEGGNIVLNVNSAKALNKVVGHEITHVLEGTDFYGKLQDSIIAYAKSKGDYDARIKSLEELYKDIEGADINEELTADLVGDYLFTDEQFINNLSTEQPNIFKRIYEEIKYFVKTVAPGSKEAKQLEKVKRMFEKAYRESTNISTDGVRRFSINNTLDDELQSVLDNTFDAERSQVYVGKSSDFLTDHIQAEPLEMLMPANKAYAAMVTKEQAKGEGRYKKELHYHGLGKDKLIETLREAENPIASYASDIEEDNSKKRENRLVLITESKIDGKYIAIVNEVSSTGRLKGKKRKANITITAFDKIDIASALLKARAENRILSLDKKRSHLIARGEERQTLNGLNEVDFNNNIARFWNNVNYKKDKTVQQNQDSEFGRGAFAEAFAKVGIETSKQQFSLSEDNQGRELSNKQTSSPGTYNVKGSDIELELPIREDVAPVQQSAVDELPIREDIPTQNDAFPDDLPIREDVVVPEEGYPTKPIQTVQERIEAKINNAKIELKNIKELRELAHDHYNSRIADKQAEYESKKNKDTKTARDILQTIENLKKLRDNDEAEFEKKISDREARIAKMSTQEYKVAQQSKTKREEQRLWSRELIGDSSTWVDKKLGIQYRVNTLHRNLRDIVRDADGNRDIGKADAINEALAGSYNRNEAIVNREANDLKQPFKKLKINKYEDAYIQMLGEYRDNPDTTISPDTMKKYYEKHKKKIDVDKVEHVIKEARRIYDELFERVNVALVEQGFKPIEYRKGYFPHFTDNPGFLSKLFNWKVQDNTIPTDIAGMTEMFNPERSWQSFDKHRTGDDTDYSFMTGFDTYVKGALDWIYHIDDIQKRRAFENEIRYQHSEQGVKDAIEEIYASEEYDADEVQGKIDEVYSKAEEKKAQVDKVYQIAKNPLNNFVEDLRRGTNNLAGKKDSFDRNLEGNTNRQVYSVMTNISNRVSANMVAGSFSSALTNFIPITQSWGEVSPISSLKAMKDTIKSVIRDDGMVDKSDFMTNRLRPVENLNKTTWDKVEDVVGIMMEAVDFFTTQTVWRSKYNENIKKGMSEAEAISNADYFAEGLMAGRSRGNMPTIFNAKNPVAKMFTAFQLEVANQYGYMFKDMPQNVGEDAKGKLVKGYLTMFAGAYAYNMLYSNLTGRDAALDPIGIIKEFLDDLFGDDEEEGDALKAVAGLGMNVAQEVPFVGGLLGGGRVPISNALPFDGSYSELMSAVGDGDASKIMKEMLNPLYYVAMPMGGGQIRKTTQGLSMFDDDLPIAGSYTDNGGLRFPVEDTPVNRLQAGLFGQWANKNAQDYIENERTPLKDKQIQEYKDVDIPIADYWKYREGLKEQDTLEEKFDYVSGLELPIDKKNILINNIVDREEEVDLTDYDKFADYEEFDFYIKNPEKYKFLQTNNIAFKEYLSSKDAYNWAYNNPEKYTVSKAVTNDVTTYRQYAKEMSEIKADVNKKGNAISGSAKKKVVSYLNNLDIDYGAKLILYRMRYGSDDKYNYEIVEYLNNREDITRSEMEVILKELGFTVDSKGNVRW